MQNFVPHRTVAFAERLLPTVWSCEQITSKTLDFCEITVSHCGASAAHSKTFGNGMKLLVFDAEFYSASNGGICSANAVDHVEL